MIKPGVLEKYKALYPNRKSYHSLRQQKRQTRTFAPMKCDKCKAVIDLGQEYVNCNYVNIHLDCL